MFMKRKTDNCFTGIDEDSAVVKSEDSENARHALELRTVMLATVTEIFFFFPLCCSLSVWLRKPQRFNVA